MTYRRLAIFVAIISVVDSSWATVRFVDAGRSGAPAPDGLSWGTAYPDIQSALIEASSDGSITEIRVSVDQYMPPSTTTPFVPRSNLHIKGGFAGVNYVSADPSVAIGDAVSSRTLVGQPGFSVRRHFLLDTVSNVVLENLELRRATGGFVTSAPDVPGSAIRAIDSSFSLINCSINGNMSKEGGAGVFAENCDFVIRTCSFGVDPAVPFSNANLSLEKGGAVLIRVTASGKSMLVDHSKFGLNNAARTPPSNTGSGGAIYLDTVAGSPLLCRYTNFSKNFTEWSDDNASRSRGGAVDVHAGEFVCHNTMFSKNSSEIGGAVYVTANGVAKFVNCVAYRNEVNSDVAFGSLYPASPGGATIYSLGALDVRNCSVGRGWVVMQPLNATGSGIYVGGGSAIIYNTLLSFNMDGGWNLTRDADLFVAGGASADVRYTHTQVSVFPGTGNVTGDPMVANNTFGDSVDLHLLPGSPMMDAGLATLLPLDVLDLDDDNDTAEVVPVDFDGVRRVRGPGVDIGAFEACRCNVNADMDHDGDFGTDADIEGFFHCLAGDCCPTCTADTDCDGDTGTDADIERWFQLLAGADGCDL